MTEPMPPLRYWEIVLNLSGYWFPRRKAKHFLAEQARIGGLWRDYYSVLKALGDIDMRSLTFVTGPYVGQRVEDVARLHGLCEPAESVPYHPFELFKKARP